jgi:hypothetical protein
MSLTVCVIISQKILRSYFAFVMILIIGSKDRRGKKTSEGNKSKSNISGIRILFVLERKDSVLKLQTPAYIHLLNFSFTRKITDRKRREKRIRHYHYYNLVCRKWANKNQKETEGKSVRKRRKETVVWYREREVYLSKLMFIFFTTK